MGNFKQNPLTEVIFLRVTPQELKQIHKAYAKCEENDPSPQAFIRRLIKEALEK